MTLLVLLVVKKVIQIKMANCESQFAIHNSIQTADKCFVILASTR